MLKSINIIFLITLLTASIVAQSNTPPCSSAKAGEFDFWVGTWELEWKTAKGEVQKGANVIRRILGGCVIEESFDGGTGLPLKGVSHSVYDANTGKWKQTWVDNSGSYLDFKGGIENGKMVLTRSFSDREGKNVMQRMVFFNIKPQSLDWNWETSKDEGKSWNLLWHISYKKKD